MIQADAELAAFLPVIESRIRDQFGAAAQIERAVVADYDDPDGRDRLYLRISSAFSLDEDIDHLTKLLDREKDDVDPFRID